MGEKHTNKSVSMKMIYFVDLHKKDNIFRL
jgi:hypothetical protein